MGMSAADNRKRAYRGRPRLRSDEETRSIVLEAARRELQTTGFNATGMEVVARRAGISTKTLYRLFPSKAELLRDLVSEHFDQFAIEFNLRRSGLVETEVGLNQMLSFYAGFALHPDLVSLQRVILQDKSNFPELAASFYAAGIIRMAGDLSKWLRDQVACGFIHVDDCEQAASFLIGMVVFEPQFAALYEGKPLPSRRQIEQQVRSCIALFLDGCRASAPTGALSRPVERN
jgi:AcrR family transcriptional regulator